MPRDVSAVPLKWVSGGIMFDFEESEFYFGAKTRKRKKDKKHKTSTTEKTRESMKKKKKKKNLNFKEELKERKQKKKEKQKRRLPLESEGGLGFKDRLSAQDEFFAALHLHVNEQPDHVTQDSKKKSRRTTKVVFDASPRHIRVKRPKFASSFITEAESVRDAGRCSQLAVTGGSPEHDSLCTSDDVNSQDLFITQKTFRKSLPGPSRGEASYRALMASPQLQMQRGDAQHPSLLEMEQGSHQLSVQSKPGEAEEHQGFHKLHKKKKKSRLSQNTNFSGERRVPCAVPLEPSAGSPFLDEPVIVKSSLEAAGKNTASCSTQTETFFSAELSSYLSFCRKNEPAASSEDLKPLDLSLPQRARGHQGGCLSVLEVKDQGGAAPKERRAPPARDETAPSPQLSESDHRSADTTASSEDSEQPWGKGKLDLIQVRAVQMRLNESFFFKAKGERPSPRSASPLMKLARGRDGRSSKRFLDAKLQP